MSAVVAFVWRTALRRGLMGGSRPWMTVFAILGVAKLVGRIAGRGSETVFVSELKPGETITISHLEDPPVS